MQTKVFLARAFGHEGIFEAFEEKKALYIVKGKFLENTWGNNHPQMKELHGRKVLGVSKTNLFELRKASELLNELF